MKVQANCTFSVKEPSVMNNGMTYIVSVGKKRKIFPHRREKTSFNQFFHVRKNYKFLVFFQKAKEKKHFLYSLGAKFRAGSGSAVGESERGGDSSR